METLKKTAATLRVLSFNIHQGITLTRSRQRFSILKKALQTEKAELLCLQEVAGSSNAHTKPEMGPGHLGSACQLDALQGRHWPYTAYGKNAVFAEGFHGNAILSRFPILSWGSVDITVPPLPRRGFLHAEIQWNKHKIQVIGIHLGLVQIERGRQIKELKKYLLKMVNPHEPLIVAGDFNDWNKKIGKLFSTDMKLSEAFLAQDKKHAKTFPSRYPMLALDRIYFRGLELVHVKRLTSPMWKKFSDHVPIVAEFKLAK